MDRSHRTEPTDFLVFNVSYVSPESFWNHAGNVGAIDDVVFSIMANTDGYVVDRSYLSVSRSNACPAPWDRYGRNIWLLGIYRPLHACIVMPRLRRKSSGIILHNVHFILCEKCHPRISLSSFRPRSLLAFPLFLLTWRSSRAHHWPWCFRYCVGFSALFCVSFYLIGICSLILWDSLLH